MNSRLIGVEREEAARLLRMARSAQSGDAIELAWTLLPHRRGVRRLMLDHLVRTGDHDRADAMVAQWRRQPNGRRCDLDPGTALIHARSQLARGLFEAARNTIRPAHHWRPNHRSTLVLTARIERAAGDPERAARLLEEAEARSPLSEEARELLVHALLESDRAADAERVLDEYPAIDPAIAARVAVARGRRLDAIELLDRAARTARANHDTNRAAYERDLIDLMIECGCHAQLRARIASDVRPADPIAFLRACLVIGDFDRCLREAFSLRRHPSARSALAVMVVAARMTGRLRLARRALAGLQRRGGLDPVQMRQLWRHGSLAQLLKRQQCSRTAGADRSQSILQPLLARAAATLDRTETSLRTAPTARLAETCREALGNPKRIRSLRRDAA